MYPRWQPLKEHLLRGKCCPPRGAAPKPKGYSGLTEGARTGAGRGETRVAAAVDGGFVNRSGVNIPPRTDASYGHIIMKPAAVTRLVDEEFVHDGCRVGAANEALHRGVILRTEGIRDRHADA